MSAATPWGADHRAAGEPKPECAAVIDRINEYIDGEVSPADLASVRNHLRECPPCLEEHDVQVALKALVRRCFLQERAPETLRLRVMASLTTVRVYREG